MINFINERKINIFFKVTLILKGFFAFIETIGGVLVFFVTKDFITDLALSEINQDPNDPFSNYLLSIGNNFSISTQHFVAWYLLIHGIVKLFLVFNLFKKKEWAYPTSVVVFGLFMIYELYELFVTHSLLILALTLLDALVIWLTLQEYSFIKNHPKHKVGN